MEDYDKLAKFNALSVEVKTSDNKIIVVSDELFERYKAEIISLDDGDASSLFSVSATNAKQNIIFCEGLLVVSETMKNSFIEQLKK